MVHVFGDLGFFVAIVKNISRTRHACTGNISGLANRCRQTERLRAPSGCSFVVADWRTGAEPFCGAPTRPGSSYCADHQPICVLSRESAEGRSRVAALMRETDEAPEPPAELAHLKESVLPESVPDDAGDLRALLDHPPPDPGARELE